MKLILFGGTGMVGSGVLREALADTEVTRVLHVGRSSCGIEHEKLSETLLADLFEFGEVLDQLTGYDACIWALGVSAMGLDEAAYSRITEELTLSWAHALLQQNPGLSLCYCSGMGAGGSAMWARVRQRVEGGLKEMPFRHSGVVRPGFIRPGPGLRSRTRAYAIGNALMKPIFLLTPLLVRAMPFLFTTSEILGRAMLRVVKGQADRYVLEARDINRLGA